LLCEQASLKPVRLGNILYITSKANSAELRTEPDLAPANPVVSPDDVNVMLQGGGVGVIGKPPIILPGGGNLPVPPDAPPAEPAPPQKEEKKVPEKENDKAPPKEVKKADK
jgi:hypothetical protein